MAAKDVKFSTEARERMLWGVDTLANAVKVTLGGRQEGRDSRGRRAADGLLTRLAPGWPTAGRSLHL
jgi:hypothetical protein